MKVLVTGGAGFIGSHLVQRLLGEGHEVRVLDNFSTGSRENLLGLGDGFELVEGDVQSYERVHTAVNGQDAVLHQAALPSVPRSVQDPLTSNAVNVTGTLNVLLASRDAGVERLVYASSSSVYGPSPELPKREEMPTAPIAPYPVAKLAGENYCRSFWRVYGLETVSLRYFNVFGPRQDPLSQYAAVIPSFIRAALNGERPRIFGDGEQSRDFTYIDNVIDANLRALEAQGVAGEVFNVACGQRVTLNQIIRDLSAVMEREVEPDYVQERPGDIAHSLADVSKAREALGYEPSVAFAEGLRRTIASLEQAQEAATSRG